VIPRQSAVAQAIRPRQDPLAHRYLWPDLVDQIAGALGHPSPPAARTEAAPLAREGHEALEGAVGAPKPGEAMGEDSAREELAELLLDEAGQAMSVAPVGGFPPEGLQMFADDGMEDRVLGVAGLIPAMGMVHALG
jgi:hypothetical protein